MIPKQAIEKAIEGGWNKRPRQQTLALENGAKVYLGNENDDRVFISVEEIALDPTFWLALGQALEWGAWVDGSPKWHSNAFLFYDLILSGGDTEAFWRELFH